MLATHTASIGSFDINQLFYLATKNIYDSEARKMLLKSNLCDIQNIIDVSKYYNEIID
ncbi:hypothetical protein FACS189459_1750 [Bacilli bacterium]|nr:hypothetical protein FACS189459_1750 [Bacilli bacterium]